MRFRASALPLVAGAALWACGSSPPPATADDEARAQPSATAEPQKPDQPEQPSASDESANAAQAKVVQEAPPVVKLLSAGKPPQQQLRYKLSAGGTQKLTLRTTTKVSGASMPLPPIVADWPVTISVDEVSADGAARFHYTMGPMKLSVAGGNGALSQALGGLMGGAGSTQVEGGGTMDSRGFIQEQAKKQAQGESGSRGEDLLAGGGPELTPSLADSADPFPQEAVGVGARWEVRSERSEAGLLIEKVSTYELLSIKGGVIKTKLRRVESPIEDPDRPTKLGGDGSDAPKKQESRGELSFRLEQLYPTGQLRMTGSLTVPGLGNSVSVDSKVDIKAR